MDTKAGTIVVGLDDSASSKRALAWAAEQAVADRRELTLVHTIDAVAGLPWTPRWFLPASARALRAAGRRVLTRARSRGQAMAPDARDARGVPTRGPTRASRRAVPRRCPGGRWGRADGQAPRLLLGSVGVALVRHAACPVVIHRPGNPGVVRNGIVVGADASEDSRTVLEFAYREASVRKLPLTVLHCFPDGQAASGRPRRGRAGSGPGDRADAARRVDGGAVGEVPRGRRTHRDGRAACLQEAAGAQG